MTHRLAKCFLPIFLIATFMFTSCSDDTDTISQIEVENYTEDAIFEMQKNARCGMRGCFEFLFPVTIVFPDGAEAEVDSYKEMRERIKAWKTNNPGEENRPKLQFPLDLITQDGEIVTAEGPQDLREITKGCIRDFIKNHPRFNNSCFQFAFPINLEKPNGDTIRIENRQEMKEMLRRWKREGGPMAAKPRIVFPVTVILKEDGSEIVLEKVEDLHALKEECRNN